MIIKVICSLIIFIPLAVFSWESSLIASLLPHLASIALLVLLIFISWFSGRWISGIVTRPFSRTKDKRRLAILVTGCDRGIGQLTALHLNRLGYFVFATCLKVDDNMETFMSSKAFNSSRLKLLQMDITKKDQVIDCVKVVRRILKNESLSLYGLVNNAGIATLGPIEYAEQGDVIDYSSVLEVNVLGTIRVTRAFLPFIRKSRGRIIIISSIMARIAAPGSNAYSISKAALSKFAEGLQLELAPFGVETVTIEPWLARTAMFNANAVTKSMRETVSTASSEVKSSYGKNYYLQMLYFNQIFSQFPVSLTNEMVVDAISESLSSAEPEVVYRVIPGILSLPIWLLNDLLPWDLVIYLRRIIFWLSFKVIWISKKTQILKSS